MSDVGTDAVARPGAGADPGAGPMVEASGLGRTYRGGGRTVHALRDVHLSVAAGELVAVRGRSGAGKTTLLNLVGGLDRPDHGKVVVAGRDVAALDEAGLVRLRREVVGFVFQTFGLIPVLTAAENVGMALRLTGTPAAEREERVRLLLALVGLEGQARQRPQELSGGQQQRVAIARALANRPRLLIADEPTAQLDSETGRSIMELIRSAVRSEGATAIVATHDATLLGVADRVLTLHDGRLVTPEDPPSA